MYIISSRGKIERSKNTKLKVYHSHNVHFKLWGEKKKKQLQVDYKTGPLKLTQINFFKRCKNIYYANGTNKNELKMVQYSKINIKNRVTQKALNVIKRMPTIAKSCNPIRRCNSQTSLHLTTKLNIHKRVYTCMCFKI